MKAFKRLCMKSRYSQKIIDTLSNYKLKSVFNLPALMFANTLIIYLLDCIILMLILTIVFHPLFWSFLWAFRNEILLIFFPNFCEDKFKAIMGALIYSEDGNDIINYNLFQFVEVVELILSIIGGLSYSCKRIVIILCHFLIKLPFFHKPTFKGSLLWGIFKDELYYSFMSNIHLHSYYNNPIFIATNEILINGPSIHKKFHKKLHLALILIKKPNLIPFQKKIFLKQKVF